MLEQQLGTAYRIERELGGGGMSRVFLAEETALARRVVIKLLPPGAAATVDADRFRREIQLAASLQHPHIVTLLNAGAGAGDSVLWYSMPYVEGESLRGRLVRDHELPIDSAVRIWRELLDALSYAHGRGVVHRDIKPENVLMSGRHALVTDFGVAKAISIATGSVSMTPTGISLGTPAYMAPEQATADPSTDHRADIYSAGLVMYEMLAGHGPFPGLASSQLAAAHATRAPEQIRLARPAVPEPLAALVMRCLEKLPADRPQTADEVLTALETIVTPLTMTPTGSVPTSTMGGSMAGIAPATPSRTRGSARMRAAIIAGVLVPLIAIAVVFAKRGPTQPARIGADPLDTTVRAIGIVDFEYAPADSVVARAVTEAVRSEILQSAKLFTLSRPNQAAFYRWALDLGEREVPHPDSATKVFVDRGWPAVVRGTVVRLGTSYALSVDVTSNTAEPVRFKTVTETAADATALSSAIGAVAKAVRTQLEEQAARLIPPIRRGLASTGSQVALRLYQDATAAVSGNAADWGTALPALREAVRVDSTFAPAWRRIARYLHNIDLRRAESVDAATRAYGERTHARTWERALIDETYHLIHEQFAQAAAAAAPGVQLGEADALANAGYEYLLQGDAGVAAGYLDRSRAESRTFSYASRLYAAALRVGGRDLAADTVVAWGATVSPASNHVSAAVTDRMIHRLDYGLLRAMLDARVHVDTLPRASGVRLATLRQLLAANLVLGRLADAQSSSERLTRAIQEFDSPADVQRELLVDIVNRAWFAVDSVALHRAADSAFAVGLPAATAILDRPFMAEFEASMAQGKVDAAASVLIQWNQLFAGPYSTIDRLARTVARADLAIARNDPRAAIALLRSAQRSKCGLCLAPRIGRAYEVLQRPDSAITEYERYVSSSTPYRYATDARELARTYKRLGELYEAKGDNKRAIQRYTNFVDLWKDADPELQPKVTEVRERIARLQEKIG